MLILQWPRFADYVLTAAFVLHFRLHQNQFQYLVFLMQPQTQNQPWKSPWFLEYCCENGVICVLLAFRNYSFLHSFFRHDSILSAKSLHSPQSCIDLIFKLDQTLGKKVLHLPWNLNNYTMCIGTSQSLWVGITHKVFACGTTEKTLVTILPPWHTVMVKWFVLRINYLRD